MRIPLDRPNVLMFVLDSVGTADYLKHEAQLPCISQLRTQSFWFPRAYCGCPESSPARASLFTGLDMAVHGVWTDGVTLPAHETTIAEQFYSSGYQTWLFGRRQLAGVANWTTEHTRAQEFSYAQWAHGPLHRSRQNAYLAWLEETKNIVYSELFPSQANPDDTQISSSTYKAISELPDELSFNHWLGNHLSDQLGNHITEHHDKQPFFAVAGLVVGESLGAVPSKDFVTEGINLQALKQADSGIAKVLQKLETTGQSEKTIVVLVSARGSTEAPDSKGAMNEHAIKVPLLLRAPGIAAKDISSSVSTMDIAPTLYELANIRAPQRTQGRSLLTEEPRKWSLSRLRQPKHNHQTALCTERYKLVAHHAQTDSGETLGFSLYDLQQDQLTVSAALDRRGLSLQTWMP